MRHEAESEETYYREQEVRPAAVDASLVKRDKYASAARRRKMAAYVVGVHVDIFWNKRDHQKTGHIGGPADSRQ